MKSSRLAIVFLSSIAIAQTWQIALPNYDFQFPRDYFSHPAYQTEWWYYTGNLHAPNGRRYGFELTFFRQANRLAAQAAASEDSTWRPDQLYLAHLALSDIDGHAFYHTERLNRAGPGLAGGELSDKRYWNGNWQVKWTALPSAQQELVAVCDRFTLRLELQAVKEPIIQGQNGVSRKGPLPGQASHYISFTRLEASGQLKQGYSSTAVSGLAWMDHEFFTEPPDSDLIGWDWFAIQLANNEELMLYRLRDRSGVFDSYSSGSYIDAQGRARFLSSIDFTLQPSRLWKSPHTGSKYPLVWQIQVPSLQLILTEQTALPDQELWNVQGDAPSYWEGAVTYKGTLRGRPTQGVGYLEMTGYQQPVRLSSR